jgi:hypothetical protein
VRAENVPAVGCAVAGEGLASSNMCWSARCDVVGPEERAGK